MKFKILSIFLVAMMLIANVAFVTAADANFQGEGTSESPYLIATADDLVKLSTLTNATPLKMQSSSFILRRALTK